MDNLWKTPVDNLWTTPVDNPQSYPQVIHSPVDNFFDPCRGQMNINDYEGIIIQPGMQGSNPNKSLRRLVIVPVISSIVKSL